MSGISIDYDPTSGNIVVRGTLDQLAKDPVVAAYLRKIGCDAGVRDRWLIPTPAADLESRFRTLSKFLEFAGAEASTDGALSEAVHRIEEDNRAFKEFTGRAAAIWNSEFGAAEFETFVDAIERNCPGRTFYRLQLLAAYHLAFSQNACNFSVPGAGKTSIVFSAFAYLRSLPKEHSKHVDRLLIAGPLSSFKVWEQEYREIFRATPVTKRIAGLVPQPDRIRFLRHQDSDYEATDLTLTSYPTLTNHAADFGVFLRDPSRKTMFVLDEAHYIKKSEGVWANAVLGLAPHAASRVILTGTPVPNGYEDLLNMFSFLYPRRNIIGFSSAALSSMSEGKLLDALPELKRSIRPFYTRIRKRDLRLPGIEEEVIKVPLMPEHQEIYRYIERTVVPALGVDSHGPSSLLLRARLIRLRQAATNPELLLKPLDEEGLRGSDYSRFSVSDARILALIEGFESKNRLAKIDELRRLVIRLLPSQPKILIWSIFLRNLDLLKAMLGDLVDSIAIISGSTPIQGDEDSEEDLATRERIIDQFLNSKGSSILVANPQAVGESISLHKSCHVAIYFDRDFNAGRFIQSKDRIHRYGLKEGVVTYYYYLVSDETIEEDIHDRLMVKELRLMELIDNDDIPLFLLATGTAAEELQRDVTAVIESYERRAVRP